MTDVAHWKSPIAVVYHGERGKGGVIEIGERGQLIFCSSHNRILTPPCGDCAPCEDPLGGAGPNSNLFTKLQDKILKKYIYY